MHGNNKTDESEHKTARPGEAFGWNEDSYFAIKKIVKKQVYVFVVAMHQLHGSVLQCAVSIAQVLKDTTWMIENEFWYFCSEW